MAEWLIVAVLLVFVLAVVVGVPTLIVLLVRSSRRRNEVQQHSGPGGRVVS